MDERVPVHLRTLKPSTIQQEEQEDISMTPSEFDYDGHFGYTPTPSPPPEVANALTQEQISMGMIKVEGISLQGGTMGPPFQPYNAYESNFDGNKRSGYSGRRMLAIPSQRKRRERDSDEDITTSGRKKPRA